MSSRILMRAGGLLLAALAASCTLSPPALKDERAKLAAADSQYEKPFDRRNLPELPAQPEWRDLLHRALLANGELEAAYFEWQAALFRVDIAGVYPNANLALGFEYMFSPERLTRFDRTTISIASDENFVLPVKTRQSAQVALDAARAAGERFRMKKFEIQQSVLGVWADYALVAEKLRIGRDDLALLRGIESAAANRVEFGGAQAELIRAGIEVRKAEDGLRNLEAESVASRAKLNGMLARDASAPLASPAAMPAPRALPADDAHLIAAAVDQNPELAELARQVDGRRDALELARLQWLPDFSPSFSATGAATQAIGAMFALPTTIPAIRGSIAEAASMQHAAEAMRRQTAQDRAASFVAALAIARNAERQAAFFEKQIRPMAETMAASLRESYANSSADYIDMIDGERALLELRMTIAEARTAREKALDTMEALMGLDLETLGAGAIKDTQQIMKAER